MRTHAAGSIFNLICQVARKLLLGHCKRKFVSSHKDFEMLIMACWVGKTDAQ